MFFRAHHELGDAAKLGVSFQLVNAQGEIIKQDGYRENEKNPMASMSKIAIALTVLHAILVEKKFTLDSNVLVDNFSPGRPNNPLDYWFFILSLGSLWAPRKEVTVGNLLSYSLMNSDNTATDTLLRLIGGPEAVDRLMRELNMQDYHCGFSCKELLANYFGLPAEKSNINILRAIGKFLSGAAYSQFPVDRELFTSNKGVCTPQMMTDLLTLLISKLGDKEHWLSTAAQILFEKMALCKTGDRLIKKGVSSFADNIQQFGAKTGGIGVVRTDAAYFRFVNGLWGVLTIMTNDSALPLEQRDAIIADIAEKIVLRNCDFLENVKTRDEEASTTPLPSLRRAAI